MDSEASQKRTVRVTILSQSYPLSLPADSSPTEVEELAQAVDELLHSIAAKAPSADSTRVAVLGCLHLADKLHILERDLLKLKERVGQKTEEFAGLLEHALEG
jgi:cell division protein ZapA